MTESAHADTFGVLEPTTERLPSRQARVAIALFVAPLLGVAAIFPLMGGDVAGCAYPIAFVIDALVGVPVSLRLLGRGAPWWQFAACGALVGAAPFLLFDAYVAVWELAKYSRIPSARNPALPLRWITAGALCGAVTATTLWRLVFRQDRD